MRLETEVVEAVSSLDRESYDAIKGRVNWSTLKNIARSPAHYLHGMTTPREDTAALRLGRAVHMAVFEPERMAAAYAIWDGGIRRGKAWDAFSERNAHREILTEAEMATCLDLSVAVRNNPVAAQYVSGGKGEQTALWTDRVYQLECKARLDFVADCGALVDLKTTRDASPGGFSKVAWAYQYHVQAAWYSDGYEAATGKRLPYVLVAVEKEAPHVVQVYRVPDAILDLGRETYRNLLGTLVDCRKASAWPGYSTAAMELELPRWAVSFADDEDLADMDLQISNQER